MNNLFYQKDLESLDIKIDISDRPVDISQEEHLSLVMRLSAFFKVLKKNQLKAKSVWKPEGEWLDYNNEKDFFYHLLLEDRYQEADQILRNFWRNRLGLIVKEYAKFENFTNNDIEVTEAFRKS